MADEAMSALEASIRKKAIDAFADDVQSSWMQALSKHGIPHSWCSSSKMAAVKNALSDIIREQSSNVGDRAVRDFIQTYEKLVVEFPQLSEGTHHE